MKTTKLVQATLQRWNVVSTAVTVVLVLLVSLGGSHSGVRADQKNVRSRFRTEEAAIHASSLRQSMNLSEFIWNGAVGLLPEVWNTTFISGVANGNMNPNFYGDYILQDAIYCRIVAQLWKQLANNASVEYDGIREYANNSYYGFQSCSIELFDAWNVKDDKQYDYGVIMEKPVREYVTFINDTMLAFPPNMLIATYACLKLWNNVTGDLLAIIENSTTTNPYAVWVHENHGSGSSMRRQAAQMDEWDIKHGWYNRTEALALFRTAVKNEINFFDKAGNSTNDLFLHTTPHVKPLVAKIDSRHDIT